MTRRHCIWILIGLPGCRRSEASHTVLPESLADVWKRITLEERPLESAPSLVTRPGLLRIWDARYEGPGKIEVRIYEMASPALSLDLVQRWQPAADTVYFYEQQYFTVVRWDRAERQPLQDFLRELQKHLGALGKD